MKQNPETNDPGEGPDSVADRNVERLIAGAYRPESPEPAMVRRVTAAMHAAARGRAVRSGRAPRRAWRLRRLVLWGAAAAVLVGLGVVLGNWLGRRAGDDMEFADRMPDVTAHETGDFRGPSPPGLRAGRGADWRGLAGVGVIAPQSPAKPQAAFRLEVGKSLATGATERRRVVLPDGSVLYLNRQTSVTLQRDRHVTLAHGEVFVEVAPRYPDEPGKLAAPDAPFIVCTPDREIVALGTRFDVRHGEAGTGVVVTQGKVQVSGMKLPLEAGQQLDPRGGRDAAGPAPVTPAPRATHVIDWTRDLMAAACLPLVPTSQYAGGALVARSPDGQESRLTLRKFHVDVHVEDGFARTTIDQTYFNHETGRLEGTFYFPLAPDASLSRLAMYVDGRLMEGGMAERGHARQVFEDIVRKMRDPALLEWIDGSTFKMRVFPLEGRQEKRIILSYTQRLPSLYGRSKYRFPAGHSMQEVGRWSSQIRVCGGADVPWQSHSHRFEATREGGDLLLKAAAEHVQPDRDIVLTLGDSGDRGDLGRVRFSSSVHEGAKYLMLRWRPELPSEKRTRRRDWVFLFESSADRDPLLARVQVDVIKTLLENAERDDTFAVLTAGTRVRMLSPRRRPATPENVREAVKWLDRTHLVGALDLGRALEAAGALAQGAENSVLVHVGSGLPVLGEKDVKALGARVPEGVRYVGVGVGRRWSQSLMRTAAGRSGGYFTQINPDEEVAWRALDLLGTLNTPRLSDVRVVDRAEKAAFLLHGDWVAQGEELCAIARLDDGQPLPERVEVTGTLDGRPFAQEIPVADVAPKADYLPRTWAKLEIDRLVADGAARHHDEIVPLSKAMYVMSPFTSLLVLENEAMYKEYNVDRGRKDHWALYPCPEKIPVVHEPLPQRPVPARSSDDGKPRRQSAEEVLGTILVRTPPRLLLWDGRRRGVPASSVYYFGWPFPYGTRGWDVDSDGDGLPDRVWVDLGLGLRTFSADLDLPFWQDGFDSGQPQFGGIGGGSASPPPSAFVEEFQRQRTLMAKVVAADVQNGINQARSKLATDPAGAVEDLKLLLESVKRAPGVDPSVRDRDLDQLQAALREAERQQVEREVRRQEDYERQATPKERRLRNEAYLMEAMRSAGAWPVPFESAPPVALRDLRHALRRFSLAQDPSFYDNAAVDGVVLGVRDGVMEISIGSDDGLNEGAVLRVFRADGSMYLGTARVLRTAPDRAVCRIDPETRHGVISKRDRVYSGGRSRTRVDPVADPVLPRGLGYGPAQADFDSLIELITSTIRPTAWEDVGRPGSIAPFETNLSIVVRQEQTFMDAMEAIERAYIPFPDEPPIVYPDAPMWARLTARRHERYDTMDLAARPSWFSAGGVKAWFTDGHAPFLRGDLDYRVYQWLMSPDQPGAGHEPLQEGSFDSDGSTQPAAPGAAERKIAETLRSPTSMEFIETPLEDVVEYFKDYHGIEIQIDKRALEDVGIGSDTPITRKAEGISLRSALRLILRDLDLTYTIQDEVLLITTPEQAECCLSTPWPENVSRRARSKGWLAKDPFERRVRYWDPRLNEDRSVFTGLAAYAPGLNTTWADLCAVVEAEAEPGDAAAPGRVDARARKLIEASRKATWHTATFRDWRKKAIFTLDFDGTGRYRYRRTTRHGLGEEVVCDGRQLWHLYRELGLAGRRDVSRFHRAALSGVVPWVLPPAADLARGADLVAVDDHTVAVVPAWVAKAGVLRSSPRPSAGPAKGSPLPSAGEGLGVRADGLAPKPDASKPTQTALTPNPSPANGRGETSALTPDPSPEDGRGEVVVPHLRTHLVFAPDGRLAERRLVRMPAGEVLLRQTYGPDGEIRLLGPKDKLLAERKIELAPCTLPDLRPDVRELVVLPMPLRSRGHVLETRGLKPEGKCETWSEEDALALLAADMAHGDGEMMRVIGRRFFDKGDRRLGFYTLLLDCLGTWETQEERDLGGGTRVRFDPLADHPESPLARYIAWWADKNHQGRKEPVGPIGGPEDGFLQQLARGHDLMVELAGLHAPVADPFADSPFATADLPRSLPKATEPADWEFAFRRAQGFVQRCRSPELAWGVVCAMRDRARNASLHWMVAEAAGRLEDTWPLGYAARYTRGVALRDASRRECCDMFERLIRDAAEAGLRPPVDATVWQAFHSTDGGADRWKKLASEVSRTLVKRGGRLTAIAMAWDLKQLGQPAQAKGVFEVATGNVPPREKLVVSLAATRYLWHTGQRDRVDATLRGLLEDKRFGQWPALWRLAAWAARRDDPGRALRCEERAMELLYQAPPAGMPLERIRLDHEALLDRYRRLGQALHAAGAEPPEEFLGRIVVAADRWRRLDPEPTRACQAAGTILGDLGAAELAWEYLTTPLAAKPNEAAPLCDLGNVLRQQGLFELADRAYASASASEPANAQTLWDRAQVLLESGRQPEAEKLLRRVAEGQWAPRFEGVKAQAKQQLSPFAPRK